MRLDIRFTTRGVETLWTHVLVGFCFKGPPGASSGLQGLENQAGGFLDGLREQGFWSAEPGETLLFPSEGRVHSQWVLLKGLGDREGLNARSRNDIVCDTGEALSKMAILDLGVHIPSMGSASQPSSLQMEETCGALIRGFVRRADRASDKVVKMVFCVESRFVEEIDSVIQTLREEFTPVLPCSFFVERKDPNPFGRNEER